MTPSSTIRLFVSSTFADMRAEREVLQREVFPRLRERCLGLGLRFQPIDLQWGVNQESSRDNRTIRICLRELRRCQSAGLKPNFLILLGDRYGWCPLPELIPAGLFEKLAMGAQEDDPKMAVLLRHWYRRDDNALPAHYLLQPREAPFEDAKRWATEVEGPLLAALQRAARNAGLETQVLHLGLSATHQEILHGALNLPSVEARRHVHAFMRSLQVPRELSVPSFFSNRREDGTPDPLADARLAALRDDLVAHLTPDNVHRYEVAWRNQGSFTNEDLAQFRDEVIRALEAVIVAQAEILQRLPAGDHEEISHVAFGAASRAGHVGHAAELAHAAEYLAGDDTRPLIVLGPAGAGKTAFVSQVAARAGAGHPTALTIARFIGATPAAARVDSLLPDLIRRIRAAYPATASADAPDEAPADEIPSDRQALVAAFHDALSRVTPARPLFLFLDALDQFTGTDSDFVMAWLPSLLPPGVRLIVSLAQPATDGVAGEKALHRIYTAITNKFSAETQLRLPPLSHADGKQVLDRWLAAAGRTLQPEQRTRVLSAFVVEGNPLWLRTAAVEAVRWESWAPPPVLPTSTAALIRGVLQRLSSENEHGLILVERALGYLACARHGLSEDEMVDRLSGDSDVMADFRRRFPLSPPVDALPVATWVPLWEDLSLYLGAQELHGATLMRFYHRVLLETVESCFLAEVEKRERHHRALAEYFARQARGRPEGLPWESNHVRGFAECVYHLAAGESWDSLEAILSDFGFLMQKTRLGLLEGLFDDWAIVDSLAPADIRQRLEISLTFFRQAAHILRRTDGEWPAYKTLLHLAMEQGDDSPLTRGAERWVAAGRCDWVWLRRVPRPPRTSQSGCRAVFEGHSARVSGALELPNGRTLSWAEEHTLRIWDIRTATTLYELIGHTEKVRGAQSLPNDQILSWSEDKTAILWDGLSGTPLYPLMGHTTPMRGALVTRDNRIVSWAGEPDILVWNKQNGRILYVLEGHAAQVGGVLELSDGRLLSWSADKTLHLWDGMGGMALRGHSDAVAGALPLKDGRIVSWSRDHTLRIWDLAGKRPPLVLEGHSRAVMGVLVLADGRLLSWSADTTLRIWDGTSGASLLALRGHLCAVSGARECADGAIVSWSIFERPLRLWDANSGDSLAVFSGHLGMVYGAAPLPDGRIVSWSDDRTVRIWNRTTPDTAVAFDDHGASVMGVRVMSDGRLLSWSTDMNLRLWALSSESQPATLEKHSAKVWGMVQLPGETVASWADDDILRLWDSASGKCLCSLPGLSARMGGASMLGNGRMLTWPWRHTLRILDTEKGTLIATLDGHAEWDEFVRRDTGDRYQNWVVGALPLSDGRILSWASDRSARLWAADTYAPLAELKGHLRAVHGALELPDHRILTWSADGSLLIWDRDGRTFTLLGRHDGEVFGALRLPDARVLSWSSDQTLQLWNVAGGPPVRLEGHTDFVDGALLLPDGRILSWSTDKTLRFWAADSGRCLEVVHEDRVEQRHLQWLVADAVARNPVPPVTLQSLFGYEGAIRRITHYPGCTSGKFFAASRFETTHLHHQNSHEVLAAWNAESVSISQCLRPDGTLVVTESSGRVNFLKLYHGSRRLSLADLQELRGWGNGSGQNGSSGAVRPHPA